MPDDDRGRTYAARCATCRWWHALGDGWGECARPDDRCADALCTTLVPPALIRVVVRQGPACGEGCCDAVLHAEAGSAAGRGSRDAIPGRRTRRIRRKAPTYRGRGFRRVAGRFRHRGRVFCTDRGGRVVTAGGVRQLGMFGEVVRPGGGRRFRVGPVPAAHGVPELPAVEVDEASLRRMCRAAERDRRVYPGWDRGDDWVAMVCGPLDAAGAGR